MTKYVRLNNGEIIVVDEENPINEFDWNMICKNWNIIGTNIAEVLEDGDLVKIEYCPLSSNDRRVELFSVYSITLDGSFIDLIGGSIDLQIIDGKVLCKAGTTECVKPVIVSVFTKEKLDNIEFTLDNSCEEKLSR